ncbi:MAG: EamA family transporter [Pseudomonadales bacterium]|mgnify:CR=1 FL=1|nr:EamA family transporter [Pseudomonadales bacterium]
MTAAVYSLALLTIFLNAVAQVMMKAGASASVKVAMSTGRAYGLIAAALLLYLLAAALWIHVLRQVDLTQVYPFMALSFVIVPLLSIMFLGEQIDFRYATGVLLIIGGILLCSRT